MMPRSCFLRRTRNECAKFGPNSRSRTGDGGSNNAGLVQSGFSFLGVHGVCLGVGIGAFVVYLHD
jgi:hypothetical protein